MLRQEHEVCSRGFAGQLAGGRRWGCPPRPGPRDLRSGGLGRGSFWLQDEILISGPGSGTSSAGSPLAFWVSRQAGRESRAQPWGGGEGSSPGAPLVLASGGRSEACPISRQTRLLLLWQLDTGLDP